MARRIPTARLNNSQEIPVMGFGTGTVWYKPDPTVGFSQDAVEMVKAAIAAGYRHLDSAELYYTEEELGVAIKECGVPRDELFITTKVYQGVGNIPQALESSLKKLQVDHVDLYLLHDPYKTMAEGVTLEDAWKDMETLQRACKTKAIGVSSFLRPHLEKILKVAEIKPAVNQIEFHPYYQRTEDYVRWVQQQGIAVQSFMGLAPITWGKGGPLDGVLSEIAARHGVPESAVLFRWTLNQDVISITTARTVSRFEDYLQALDLQLSEEEMERISTVGRSHHLRVYLNEHFSSDDRS
ncbi:hypothetical protein PG994_002277 [Apiospora phragmitis]|uniref:NADP-dependent oxidoreductase domain-containing protein n=1 Tax=Apiospora phragmitis TaxID=2905665 RepID=A0ABR1WVW5_9PEZI